MPVSKPKAPTAWDKEALRDPHARDDKAQRVQAMFDSIAPTYERVNTLATFGLDAMWRRRAVRAACAQPGELVLDVCCGTGDMIRAFAEAQPRLRAILGVDFAAEMLACGRYPADPPPIHLFRADGLRLPLADASVDVVSCAFGVRNFQDLPAGLAEFRRVLRAGGRAVILEFAQPANPVMRWANDLYCNLVLPWLGRWVSGDPNCAYRYLPRSIQTFDTRRPFEQRLRAARFDEVASEAMNFGGVVLYVARCR